MKTFTTRTFEIPTSKLNGRPVCFAVLADLHGLVFGTNHQKLYQAIMSQKPDAILIPGDMIVSRETDTLPLAASLILRLIQDIPVYYSLGNHEYKMLLKPERRESYLNYERLLTSAGVCFLHNEQILTEFGNTDFTFHGLELPIKFYHKPNSPSLSLTEMEHMLGIPSDKSFHVLLAHNPKYGRTYFSWGADLTVCGHYHGGILRFGKNHGLTCPQVLLFPPFCCGDFHRGSRHMVVSAGLGEHTIPIRIHNPRELVIIKLLPSKAGVVVEPNYNRKEP